jgi:bifunctional DNA-binding transcriptional regulator/antitoxin component of YhaV-PrlF toxin-antitoxin module
VVFVVNLFIRRQVGLSEGDQIAFIAQGDHIFIQPLPKSLLELRGSIPVSGPQDFAEIRRQVRVGRARRSYPILKDKRSSCPEETCQVSSDCRPVPEMALS